MLRLAFNPLYTPGTALGARGPHLLRDMGLSATCNTYTIRLPMLASPPHRCPVGHPPDDETQTTGLVLVAELSRRHTYDNDNLHIARQVGG